jgi:MFS family permease
LRRVQLALFAFNASEWAVWIAILVYAYGQGGATEAGIVAVIQLLPAALFGPLPAVFADRGSPARILTIGYVLQAVTMSAVGVAMIAGGPRILVYVLAAVAATAVTITRPAQSVLVPILARRPEELTATNIVSGWNESVSALASPALAGVIMAAAGPGWVFVAMAGITFVAAVLVAPLTDDKEDEDADLVDEDEIDLGIWAEIGAGFQVLKQHRHVRLLVLLIAAQFVALGALDVVAVVLAISILHIGEGGAGYLNSAFGAGGVISIVFMAGLVGRKRLVPPLLIAAAVWGVAFVVLGLESSVVIALLLLACAGAARTLFDVTGNTLLQRSVAPDLVSRVFGLVEGLSMIGMAIGSLLVPLIVSAIGANAAVIGTGFVLPIAVLIGGRKLFDIDSHATVPIVEIALLKSQRLFAGLPAPQLEGLARRLITIDLAPDEILIREGDVGDRFYVIGEGEVEVTKEGKHVAVLGRSDAFGEIALLHDIPRTATCTAKTQARVYALERETFLEAVIGHHRSTQIADRVVTGRLAELEQLAGP